MEDFADAQYVEIQPEAVPADEQRQTVSYSVAVKDGKDAIANVEIDADENGKPRLKITSIENANGTQVFTVTANDGQGPDNNSTYTQDFTLTITAVNDAPAFTLSSERVEKKEDFLGTETIVVSSQNPENEKEAVAYSLSPESVAFASVAIDETSGTISITAVKDGFGEREFTVTAKDAGGATATATFTLIVTPENDAPAFELSSDRVEKQEDFTGTETVTVINQVNPANEKEAVAYSLSPESVAFANVAIDETSGTISISAVKDGFGEREFTVTAKDAGGATATATFTLIVTPENDAPAFELSSDRVEKQEDFTGTETVTVINQVNPANEKEAVAYSLSPESVAFASVAIDETSGTISISAVKDGFGEREFTVTAKDAGGATATATFTLIITPENDAPSFELNQYDIVKEEDFAGTEVVRVKNQINPANEGETIEYSLQPAADEVDLRGACF